MTAAAPAPERIVARLRSHPRVLVVPVLLLVAVAGGGTYLAGVLRESWQLALLAVGAALVLVLGVLLPWLGWLGLRYTITTRRLVLRTGVLVRTRRELLHSRGYDVTVRTAGLQFVFGSGDVIVNAGLDRPVVLRDVPRAGLVQAALHDLMEDSANAVSIRRQRGEAL